MLATATNQPNTELASHDGKSNRGCLVKVKGQVMTRDDSTGMWVPLSGGGMSIVSLHRIIVSSSSSSSSSSTRPADEDLMEEVENAQHPQAAYVILGQRIADKSMALHCELLSDLQYTSVNPTFHHWTTNGKRFGLTFQTSSDATAFQKTIQRVEQNIRQGSKAQLHTMAEEVLTVLQQAQSSTKNVTGDLDKISNLPNKDDPSPFSSEVTAQAGTRPQCITPRVYVKQRHPVMDAPSNISPQVPSLSPPLENTSRLLPDTSGVTLGDYGFYVDVTADAGKTPDRWPPDASSKDVGRKLQLFQLPSEEDGLIYIGGSYVHFAKNNDTEKHDYCYPSFDSVRFPPYGTVPRSLRPSGGAAGQTHVSTPIPVPLPIKSRRKWLRRKKKSLSLNTSTRHHIQNQSPKIQCIYCQEYFSADDNRKGSCKDAPDRVLTCIKAATCVCCQEAIACYCKGDEEDPGESDYLNCDFGSRHGGSCRKRAILVLICLVVPCLWCYFPLRTCHRLGVACGCCGPRHKAA